MIYYIYDRMGGRDMDELEKKPDAPQKAAEKKPERKNDFDNRRKLMYVLCGG